MSVCALIVVAFPTSAAGAGLSEAWQEDGTFPDYLPPEDPFADSSRTQHIAVRGEDGDVWLISGLSNVAYQAGVVTRSVGGWGFRNVFSDDPRWGSAGVSYGRFIYRIGGALNSGNANDVWLITGGDNEAVNGRIVARLPSAREEMAATVVNGRLFVSGGLGVSLDARAEVWSAPINPGGTIGAFRRVTELPAGRSQHQMVFSRGRLYVLGGNSGREGALVPKETVWSAAVGSDGTLGTWRTEASLPEAVLDHAAVAVGNDIYVIGGRTATGTSANTNFASVELSAGEIRRWQTSPYRLPEGRAGHAAVALGPTGSPDGILITGGETTEGRVLNDALFAGASSLWGDQELLESYRPQMRYAQEEIFEADSAAEATDWVREDRRSNYLKRDRRIIAASDSSARYDDLSLRYLETYRAQTGDFLDLEGNELFDFVVAAYTLHNRPEYGDKIYGRVYHAANGDYVMQYFFFYYYNAKEFAPGFGPHEGDWEMIQIRTNEQQVPLLATYAQHRKSERCAWEQVQTTEDGRPVVYVARESHASYFFSGPHGIQGPYTDETSGRGNPVDPVVESVTPPPAWFMWPGKWGATRTQIRIGWEDPESPLSPSRQGDKWDDPLRWEAGAAACTA